MQLKKRLNTDRSLQPLLARFVPHVVHMNDKKQMSEFSRQFKLKQISLPMMVISDTEGNAVEVVNGAPQGDKLPRFILSGLEKSGAVKPGKPDRGLQEEDPTRDTSDADDEAKVAREVSGLIREKKYSEAIAALEPHFDSDNRAIRRLVSSLNSRAGRMLNNATRQLAKGETEQLKGVLEIVRVYRVYGELPSLADRFDAALANVRKIDGLLTQAEAVDKGRAAEEVGEQDAAIEAYEAVVNEFPDTAAAKLCAIRLEQLKR